MDPFYFGPPDQQLLDAAAAAAVDDEDYDYLMASLGLVLSPAPGVPLLPPGGAFEAYQQRRVPALLEYSSLTTSQEQNLHRRMFGYLRRIARDDAAAASTGAVVAPAFLAAPAADETTTAAGSQSQSTQAPRSSRFRHIMRERLRRERLSQGFADLHALLPPGARASSKGGKNDIVGAAAGYIRGLGARKERLRARNEALLQRAATRWRGGGTTRSMVVKVQAESQDHSVAVHAFERVLQRLKAMEDLQVTAIRSRFSSAGGMWMNVGVQGQVSTHDVDKAITNALMELEENDPRSSKPISFSCQVESGHSQMG